MRNSLNQLAKGESIAVRDAVLNIGNLMSSFTILNGLCNQDDLATILTRCTTTVIDCFNNCAELTECGRKIDLLKIPEGVDIITMPCNSKNVTSDDIQEYIDKKYKDTQETTVDVKLIPMNWFFRG